MIFLTLVTELPYNWKLRMGAGGGWRLHTGQFRERSWGPIAVRLVPGSIPVGAAGGRMEQGAVSGAALRLSSVGGGDPAHVRVRGVRRRRHQVFGGGVVGQLVRRVQVQVGGPQRCGLPKGPRWPRRSLTTKMDSLFTYYTKDSQAFFLLDVLLSTRTYNIFSWGGNSSTLRYTPGCEQPGGTHCNFLR